MTIIANPIYDSVFKFLLEDDRAAKILLSALLKQEIRSLKMRGHEYTNLQRTPISLFRIDFSARVVNAAGEERLVLIELQKTWLATETLRFRQYLGSQYADKGNVPEEDNPKGFGLPLISIYILGHKVGNLTQPVVYVRRQYLDYDNQAIANGVPDPFIESLTHDSIIVQIPYLKGRTRNRLEKLLLIFDQDYRLAYDDHLLHIDEAEMGSEGHLLVNRLVMAAASPDVRRDMQVEDEILSEIESRDTTIMLKEQEIKQKEQVIEEKKQEIEQKEQVIEEKKQEIERKEREIRQRKQMIEQKEQELGMKDEQIEKLQQVSVRLLAAQGLPPAEIARMLALSEITVSQILENG